MPRNKKHVYSVKEIYQRASKNVLKPNTIFTEDIWFARLIGRKVATYFTWIFLQTGTAPNTVTVISVIIGCIGSLFFLVPNLWFLLAGLIIFSLYLFLDSSDGELARFTGKTSSLGSYLDTIGHVLIYSCLYIALGINIYLRTLQPIFIAVGFITALTFSIASLVHHLDPLMQKNTYLELRKKENKLLFLLKNVYNFITEDLNITFAVVIFGLIQYLNLTKIDFIAYLLILNLFLLSVFGVFFNIFLKLNDKRYTN